MGKGQKRPRPGERPPIDDARKHPPSPTPPPRIAISFERYESGNRYCLSRYTEEQIQVFLDGLRKLSERTWPQLLAGSSRNPALKTGLNSTAYDRSALRNPDLWPAWLDSGKKLLGIRASERSRFFGVRSGDFFVVFWIDEGHNVVSG